LFAGLGLSLLPVVAFLLALVFLDSYKLVPLRLVVVVTVGGMCVALAAFLIARGLLPVWPGGPYAYVRGPAPLFEEIGKSAICVFLILRNRVGFMVDAAIAGFAVGTGFAVVENVYYVVSAADATMLTWVVRGFGTAVMHGGVTAIFAVLTKTIHDLRPGLGFAAALPGLVVAFLLHAAYNSFLLPPGLSMMVVVIVIPTLLTIVFIRSEAATRRWLGVGFDTDQELLQLILAGEVAETRVGRYLDTLKSRFEPLVVADMLCWLRIHLELSIHAKGLLLMREAGFDVKPNDDVDAKLAELAYTEGQIGRTGVLAISPFVHTSQKELWQLRLLGGGGGRWRQSEN
jgi:RsiW-degrading membrane proteinase PrsW (M82 family)